MKKAIIIGGGPAGLTAAYEFLKHTDVKPVVLEMSEYWGGISRTVNYKGNRIDIGGHRFFSKSDRVMEWWLEIMPIEESQKGSFEISYQNKKRTVQASGEKPKDADVVMLIRNRLSRIYYRRKFFDYPISMSVQTVKNLGIPYTIGVGFSYIWSALFPIRNEKNLEEFFINRFGKKLYLTFFKDYTEKVWGVDCNKISPEWGAQRVKGLSLTKTLMHMMKKAFGGSKKADISQKDTETSLIERFMYPKFGPGQMWETVADMVAEKGGELHMHSKVMGIRVEGNKIAGLEIENTQTGERWLAEGDYYLSTMPIQELINKLSVPVPPNVKRVSDGLMYRDFFTVGLLVSNLKVGDVKDNWIYIQESDVKVGRLQIFNNWSPYLVADPNLKWIGLEYFCNEGDALWSQSDEALKKLGKEEISKIGIVDAKDVVDAVIIRMPKTYPAYFGTYNEFDTVRDYLDGFENLFLMGRNGMHKYNNQDHSMLTAMTVVENIRDGKTTKANIWDINTEQEYHEEK
jgi:protoporphyrinogen oxidase